MTPWDWAGSDPLTAAILLLYVGPDQILPLTSALGAIMGVILLFWQRLAVIIGKFRQWFLVKILRRPDTPPPKAQTSKADASARPAGLSAAASSDGEKR